MSTQQSNAINCEESKIKQNKEKQDFEQYIIEKYNSMKNKQGQNLQMNSSYTSPKQSDLQQDIFSRLNSNLTASKSNSLASNFIETQNLMKNSKQASNKVNFSLYYNDLQEQLNKYGIKVSRYSDKLNKILEEPTKINENENSMYEKSQQQSILLSSKSASNYFTKFQTSQMSKQSNERQSSYLQTEQKNLKKQQNQAESNLKSHLFKKQLKEMQAKLLQHENFYDRVKDLPINEEDYIKLKNNGRAIISQNINNTQNLSLRNTQQNQRSNSFDYGIASMKSSNTKSNYQAKFTRLGMVKQKSQESDIYSSLSPIMTEESNPFFSSFDEVKQIESSCNSNSFQKESDNQQDLNAKLLESNNQNTQLQYSNSQSLPFQRQWAISSPLTRQSPFKPKRLPEILCKQEGGNDYSKLILRDQKQRQSFLRNRFFDIHFDSFDHKLLKLKESNKKELSNLLNPNQHDEQNDTINEESKDQSHFRVKRKPSIFHQKSSSVLNQSPLSQRDNLERQIHTPSSLRVKVAKNTYEAPKQRFVKPYPAFVRNDGSESARKPVLNTSQQSKDDSEQQEENIYQLNEKLIEGLEYNIDRFMDKFRCKIFNNQKLFDEIKQDCYIFDFEQFLINLKNFIFSSISKSAQTNNQQVNTIRRTSMLFEGVSKSIKFNLFKQQKCNVQEIINIILSNLLTPNLTKQEKPVQNNRMPNKKNKIKVQESADYQSSPIGSEKNLDENEKKDQELTSRQNSINSFQGSNQKMSNMNSPSQYLQKQDYSPKSPQMNKQKTSNPQSERSIKASFLEKNQLNNAESPQSVQQSIYNQQTFQNYSNQFEEQSTKQQIQNKKLLEQRKKEEDILYNYMQIGYNDIQNYSKTNLKLTQNIFDQIIEIIMEILIEFQYSNLSINQYIGSLYNKASSILGVSVRQEIPPNLYEKVIQTTISKMELQQKQSANLTKFLHAVFDVEEDVILKRNSLENSGSDKRSQQLLAAIKEIASSCQINYLQFYSLKLFLYETMKDIQSNFKTIEKAIFYIEAFRSILCTIQHTFVVEKQSKNNLQEQDNNQEIYSFQFEQRKHQEYIIDFSSKSSMRKLIDEFLWQLQHEMIEFMQSDSKLHNEMELFIGDLIFSLAGIYPQKQILMHKNLSVLQKSFYDQVIYNLCKLLFLKKIPIEEIRNIFVSSQQISSLLNFEPKLIINLGGFISVLQLSFLFSSVFYMDKYKAKCSVSSNVSLIQQQTNLSQAQQSQEEDNTQIIIAIIKDYQLIWFEYLIASYFSSYPTFNSYDVKAAFHINKIDEQIIIRWMQYLSKLGTYFDQYSIDKFIQELSISIGYIK